MKLVILLSSLIFSNLWAQIALDSVTLTLPSAPVVPNRYDTKWNPALPLAQGADGTWWLAYSDAQVQTRVLRLSTNLSSILIQKSFAGERVAGLSNTPSGYALALAKDSSTWSLVSWDTTAGDSVFRRTFIGTRPRTESQSKFDPMRWGASRVVYGNQSVASYFSHQMNWADPGLAPDVHQGDYLGYTNMQGDSVAGGWTWGTSHSLALDMIYDGRSYVTVSLGDAYPKAFTFRRPGKMNTKSVYAVDGDGAGWANGVLGQVHAWQNNRYALTFATPQSRQGWDPAVLVLDSSGNGVDTLWTTQRAAATPIVVDVVRSAFLGEDLLILWTERDTVSRVSKTWMSAWSIAGVQKIAPTQISATLMRGDNLQSNLDRSQVIWAVAKASSVQFYVLSGSVSTPVLRDVKPYQKGFDLLRKNPVDLLGRAVKNLSGQ